MKSIAVLALLAVAVVGVDPSPQQMLRFEGQEPFLASWRTDVILKTLNEEWNLVVQQPKDTNWKRLTFYVEAYKSLGYTPRGKTSNAFDRSITLFKDWCGGFAAFGYLRAGGKKPMQMALASTVKIKAALDTSFAAITKREDVKVGDILITGKTASKPAGVHITTIEHVYPHDDATDTTTVLTIEGNGRGVQGGIVNDPKFDGKDKFKKDNWDTTDASGWQAKHKGRGVVKRLRELDFDKVLVYRAFESQFEQQRCDGEFRCQKKTDCAKLAAAKTHMLVGGWCHKAGEVCCVPTSPADLGGKTDEDHWNAMTCKFNKKHTGATGGVCMRARHCEGVNGKFQMETANKDGIKGEGHATYLPTSSALVESTAGGLCPGATRNSETVCCFGGLMNHLASTYDDQSAEN